MGHPFGDIVNQYLHKKYGLNISKLAKQIGYERSYIGLMMHGERLTGETARQRVLAIVMGLNEFGVLSAQEEANKLLAAAGLSNLDPNSDIDIEIKLLNKLVPETSNIPTLQQQRNRQMISGLLPPYPQLLIGRDDAVAELTSMLTNNPGDISDRRVALRGWPGVGKSSVAARVAYETAITRSFPEGILWASLGQEPQDPLPQLQAWGRAIGATNLEECKKASEAAGRLRSWCAQKRLLLIIDDVWDLDNLQPYLIGGAQAVTLITTRRTQLAELFTSNVYYLEVLKPDDAYLLLRQLAEQVVSQYPDETRGLIANIEYLPLAIRVAGPLLQFYMTSGSDVPKFLEQLNQEAVLLNQTAPNDFLRDTPNMTIAALLRKSIDILSPPIVRECFLYLGGFAPKPALFSLRHIEGVWGPLLANNNYNIDVESVVRILVGQGLLEFYPDRARYTIHALLCLLSHTLLEGEDE